MAVSFFAARRPNPPGPEPGNWVLGTSNFGTSMINDVHYDNGVWVICGKNSKTATAVDPTAPFVLQTVLPSANNTYFQTHFGDGVWTLTGHIVAPPPMYTAGPKLFTTANPAAAWVERDSGFRPPDKAYPTGIAYGEGMWTMVGNEGRLNTTNNPTTLWIMRNSNTNRLLVDVHYANGIWAAVGDNGVIITADNPEQPWVVRVSGVEVPYDVQANRLSAIYYGNGHWVTVGWDGILLVAHDPRELWGRVESTFDDSHIEGVFYADGMWVIVGADGKIAQAVNPFGPWEQVVNPFGATVIKDVHFGNGVWTAVGANGVLATNG